ncbi:MAG TPA: carboxypeptidase-like regulatory domain-containing protein, partial [Chitinophagaceae bacterium]
MRKYLLSGVLPVFLSMFFFLSSLAQERVLTGTVRDDKQAPLAGATVSVKETKAMTTTDANGQFSIRVGANGKTLVISYVGMEAREVAIGSSNTVNASLVPTGTTMTDVVVVGYGRARRANLTTAQVSVGAKEIEKTVNTTLEQALQGRAAGVYITQNSGQPGGGISVNIRGVSSVNGNTEPLYVIDGVQIMGG